MTTYDKNCINCVESHYGICEKHFIEDMKEHRDDTK